MRPRKVCITAKRASKMHHLSFNLYSRGISNQALAYRMDMPGKYLLGHL